MKYEGIAFKFGDSINTDFIISGRYKFSITDMKELSKYLFEDIRPDFASLLNPGYSILVAGENFGMGSSREQAPWVIKEAGILCVVAKSFARIFYRNAFNIGLALIEANTDTIDEGNTIEIDLGQGTMHNKTKHEDLSFKPLTSFQRDLIDEKGIINYLRKHKDLVVEVKS